VSAAWPLLRPVFVVSLHSSTVPSTSAPLASPLQMPHISKTTHTFKYVQGSWRSEVAFPCPSHALCLPRMAVFPTQFTSNRCVPCNLLRHKWADVFQASWKKYPHPRRPDILHVDVINKEFDPEKGTLTTTRIVFSKGPLPLWLRPVRSRHLHLRSHSPSLNSYGHANLYIDLLTSVL